MENKPRKLSGTFFNCISIDRNYNNQQSILPHMHDNRLELFYVCSGQGQYMVDNRYYPIGEGDIVICNQGVLHGEEPDQVRQIRSYSVAITDVNAEGLPPNCLIAEGEYPVVSCGQLARQVGETMHLLYLLSADAGNLHAVCCSLAEAMLNLTDSLLHSRIHQQEQQREMPSVLAHRVRRYLDAHHCEPITLRMVAERLRVSAHLIAFVLQMPKKREHASLFFDFWREKVSTIERNFRTTLERPTVRSSCRPNCSLATAYRRMAQPRERAAPPVKWRCV